MKRYLYAFLMCQSMFCAIPCPWKIWDEEARNKMLLFLPLVGLEIGMLWALLAWIVQIINLPNLVSGIILSAYPFIITGFIHLDGFMDVTDAVKSWRELERRREILKDSHVGSFAVIGCVLLMLTQFALFTSVSDHADFRILLFIPIISRCCSSLAVTILKPMSTSQYAVQDKPKLHIFVLTAMVCVITIIGFLLCGKFAFALIGCIVGYGIALFRGYKSLEGVNGDIAGYALTIGELCATAVYALI